MFPHGIIFEHLPDVMEKQAEVFKDSIDIAKKRDVTKEDNVVSWLNAAVSGGNEICLDMGLNWTYPSYSAILAMAKKNSNVWGRLSFNVQNKIDLLCRCMLVSINAIGSDLNNDMHTGFGFRGNTCVEWSTNHKLPLVAPYIFLQDFFGGQEETVRILSEFDYDEYMSQISNAGFVNIERVWSTRVKDASGNIFGAQDLLKYNYDGDKKLNVSILDKDGNIVSFGGYAGVKNPFIYKDRTSAIGIMEMLFGMCFPDAAIINSTTEKDGVNCYILDGTETPYSGRARGCRELDMAQRSCAWHASIVVFMCIEIISAMYALGMLHHSLDVADMSGMQRYYNRIFCGVNDVFYKLDHGYHCYDFFSEKDVNYKKMCGTFPQLCIDRSIWDDLSRIY